MAIKNTIPTAFLTGLQRAMAPFEDPTGLERELWRDFSRYDLEVNLLVGQQNGVNGMAGRCVMGWSGVDPTFPGLWSQAGDLDNYYRTSYGVLYPSLSVPRFCDHWFKHHPDIDIIPRVLDAEVQDGQTDAKVGEKIWEACEIIYEYDGKYPIIYSRYLLLDKWLRYWSQEMIEKMYYWGARYLWDRTREHPGPVYGKMNYVEIPEDNWVLHQTADKKRPFPGETQRSTIVDWDRWIIGKGQQMHQWIKEKWGGGGTPSTSWSHDIDAWARTKGFETEYAPPGI